MAVYGCYAVKDGIACWGRCIGHGGMPVELGGPKTDSPCPLVTFDGRIYQCLKDGPVGYNGLVNCTFEGNTFTAVYLDLKGTEMLRECWRVDPNGSLQGVSISAPGDLNQTQNVQAAIKGRP